MNRNSFKPVEVKKRGNRYQLYYYSPDGQRRRLSAGSDYQLVQRMAVRFNDWLMEGKDPEHEMERAKQSENLRKISLRELYPEFIEKHGSKQSRAMQNLYYYNFKNISGCKQLVDKAIFEITMSNVSDYMDLRMKMDKVKPSTVNREATMIRCMLNFAVRRGYIDKNPLQGFKLLKESPKREVNISPGQIALLIDKLPESIGNIVEFAVLSGFRKENILSLKIHQIRFYDLQGGGEVDLFVKGGRWETKPLNHEAAEVLKRAIGARQDQDGYVFINIETGTRYDRNLVTFDRVVRKLGLKTVAGDKLSFHDLRRIFSTWLIDGGVGIETVQYFLGHKSISTTSRYTTMNRKVMGERLSVLPTIPRNKKVSTHDKPRP